MAETKQKPSPRGPHQKGIEWPNFYQDQKGNYDMDGVSYDGETIYVAGALRRPKIKRPRASFHRHSDSTRAS